MIKTFCDVCTLKEAVKGVLAHYDDTIPEFLSDEDKNTLEGILAP